MGYTNLTETSIRTYVPSDDIVAANDSVKSSNSTVYVKLKELSLLSDIGEPSLFRMVFDCQRTIVGVATAKIYRNGIAVGTERTSAGGWATFTEDIVTTAWKIGDTVELWGYINNAGGTIEVRNFRLSGVGSEWGVTL